MASLYKRKTSCFWWIMYADGDRMVRQSTKVRHLGRKTPPETALAILRAIEDRIARQQFGLPIRATNKEVKTWLLEYLKWYQDAKKLAASTIYSIGYNAQPFLRFAGDKMLSEISPQLVAAYFTQRKISNKTQKNEASFWAACWDRARALNLISFEQNLWREFVPARITPTEDPRPLTAEECAVLMEKSEGWKRFLIWVGYYTGERFTAILELKIADVDFDKNVIRFTETKQAKRSKTPRIRFVYLVGPLKTFLQAWKPHGATWIDSALIEKNRSGRSVSHNMGDFFERLRDQKTGFLVGASFHSLRHTFATTLANAGISRSDRMEILDHSTIQAHAGYVHEQAEKAQAHGKILEKVFTPTAHVES